MKKLLACMAAAALSLASPGHATVVTTAAFTAGQNISFSVETQHLGFAAPGDYAFTLDFTVPVEGFSGDVFKASFADQYCSDHGYLGLCSGGLLGTPTTDLTKSGSLEYTADISVIAPYELPQPYGFVYFYDQCCYVEGHFKALEAGSYTISIFSQNALGTPEPEAWAFMILGFGAIGLALRRQGSPAARADVASSSAAR